ncbi:MAG: hypothetical protein QM602_05745 [Microbacterium sp.]
MSCRLVRHPSIAAATGVLFVGLLTAGCAPEPEQTPTSPARSASAVTQSPSPSPTASAGPVLHPDGSAADNLPLFAAVTKKVWGSSNKAKGRAYVDALVRAGFDKAAMQVTKDTSTVGNAAESIQFSVLWEGECLVGQVGPATGKPVTAVMPALEGDLCLVGNTRTIDW